MHNQMATCDILKSGRKFQIVGVNYNWDGGKPYYDASKSWIDGGKIEL